LYVHLPPVAGRVPAVSAGAKASKAGVADRCLTVAACANSARRRSLACARITSVGLLAWGR